MTSVRAEIRAEVLGRLDQTTDEVVARIAAEVPAYAALSRAQLGEVRDIARWGTTRVLDLWVGNSDLTASDVRRFKGIGAARALDGRPLPGVLRAYRLAGSHLTEVIERVGGPRLTSGDAMALARLWMATIDTLSEALYAGHAAAATRLAGDRERAVGDLLDDLLLGRQVTRTGLADRGRELGLALSAEVTLVLLVSDPTGHPAGDPPVGPALEALVAELGSANGQDLAGRTLSHVRAGVGVLVLPGGLDVGDGPVRARRWRGVAMRALRVSDLPRAFRLAQHLVERAPVRAFADRAVLDEADALVVALLAGHSDGDADRLHDLVLRALDACGAEHLAEGLGAYLATGSAAGAAQALGLHAQTMRHRVRRVVAVTGRDPRRPWDRFVLEAAAVAAPHTADGS